MDFVDMYLNGASIPEVSDKTGIPRSTIRFRLMRLGILRDRADAVRLAGEKGRLGSGMRGKKREFSEEWKRAISKSKTGKGRGFTTKPAGYIEITMGPNKGRSQHCVIMEAHIGRKLNHDECVHHVNGVKNDNRIENLMVMTKKEHASLHAKENYPSRKKDKIGRLV